MREYSQPITISLPPSYIKVLSRWQGQLQCGRSEAIRKVIEECSDFDFKKNGLFTQFVQREKNSG